MEFSEPKFLGKIGYFDGGFIKIGEKKYKLVGTDRIDKRYLLTLKNIETNEYRSIDYNTVINWFKTN